MSKVVLADPERVLLEEIADPRMKRADVAASYALALKTPDEVDWKKVKRRHHGALVAVGAEVDQDASLENR